MVYKPYFKYLDGPPPLSVSCRRMVRLEEVDVLGIVWHGRYAGYFEDGREEIGRQFGLSYIEFKQAGALLPIRTLHVDYLLPLHYLETFDLETTMHWHEAARLNIEYKIFNSERRLTTQGYSVQMMIDLEGNLLLEAPAFFRDFQKRWRLGELTPCGY
ncbi:MAG: acyl-CoA thioesterase [Deltaproteobacteria bacterium]|jgi:acyl-CoA thioester hydrolase|nr:acyl-CoA thioesterase [Deltaproteobacteria bacterium]